MLSPQDRAQLGVLKKCQYCPRMINGLDYNADGCCQSCRMHGHAWLTYMIEQSSPKWRVWEKRLGLKTAGTVAAKGKVFR